MSTIFVALLLLTLVVGIISVIKPGTKKTGERYRRVDMAAGFGVVAAVLFVLVGVTAPHPKTVTVQQAKFQTNTAQQPAMQQAAPVITTKQETETQPVAYETQNHDDSSLPKDQTKVTQQGKDGTETVTYTVTYTDGAQTDRQLLSTVVTTLPVTQMVAVGTYVAPTQPACTNGTYVNSAGNTVCSPENVTSEPAGATAQCKDGTYSFSQTHSGTCSHHGGVARWL